MGHTLPFFLGHFGSRHLQSFVHLHHIGIDDFARKMLRKVHTQLGFAHACRPHHDNDFWDDGGGRGGHATNHTWYLSGKQSNGGGVEKGLNQGVGGAKMFSVVVVAAATSFRISVER